MSDSIQKPPNETLSNGLETNLRGVAQWIFSREPSPPYSVGLELDHPVNSTQDPAQVLQEMLTILLLFGVQIKYGRETNLSDLSSEQRQKIREYMWSVGFDVVLTIDPDDQDNFKLDFRPYQVKK